MKLSRRPRPREIDSKIDDTLLGYEAATPHLTVPSGSFPSSRTRRRGGRAGARSLLAAFAAVIMALPG
ncbi:hypothetical protein HLB44_28100 [Aquincola sp. S2]|uniref:Uncharacterized protein n=1 Tax=Pseudaquabacterium terrae TaxID=2732868 RepID=A0ABX2EQM1_9BURK|nr:hypothetical protein [Aquabacterium terrae]NRF70874.1 hypothetical protein [Aquabacterium terrae]